MLSLIWLSATLWTVAHQTPLSMGFSRQESWCGLPFPTPGIKPVSPVSPALQADSLPTEPSGKPLDVVTLIYFFLCFQIQKALPRSLSRRLLPMLSSGNLMVSNLTFESFIHFELILCRVKRVVWFHSFACGCPVFTVAFIEETVLSLLYILGSSVIN